MKTQFSRRQMLLAGVVGSAGLLAACAPAAQTKTPASAPQAAADAPAAPTTAPAPVIPVATTAPAAQVQAQSEAAGKYENAPTAVTVPTAPAMALNAGTTLNASIAAAARTFLDTLDTQQRGSAVFAFDAEERLRWHWTNTRNFPRNGLSLNDMQPGQRVTAMALLHASLSESGYQKATAIMNLQTEISGDPNNYFVSVFGGPDDALWGWRFEGHHVSRHFTLRGDKITISPFFQGVWPSTSPAGAGIMNREEWAARELLRSLTPAQRNDVVYDNQPPGQHVTWNANFVKPLPAAGAPIGAFNSEQRALVSEILQAWLGTLAKPMADEHLARVNAASQDAIRFGWAGSTDEHRPHYYRIQGPGFLLEHDNTRNAAAHIHSVWRVFDEDFGQGLV